MQYFFSNHFQLNYFEKRSKTNDCFVYTITYVIGVWMGNVNDKQWKNMQKQTNNQTKTTHLFLIRWNIFQCDYG